jgi:cytochrome c oxidase subunit I+III
MRLPGPGWSPVFAAVFTAAFFLLLTVKLVTIAMICGVLAIVSVLVWMWGSDPPPTEPVDIGGGLVLPTYATGPLSHSWWAMIVLMLVAGALFFSYLFGYLYLWTVSPQNWPRLDGLPPLQTALTAAALLLVSGSAIPIAAALLKARRCWPSLVVATLGVATYVAAITMDGWSQWASGLRPDGSGYSALVFMSSVLQAEIAIPCVLMAGFLVVRLAAGRFDATRRVMFDNLALLWGYGIAQALFGMLLTHGFPRLVG